MTNSPMTSTETPWTDAKIAAMANRDRPLRNAALVLSLLFFAVAILSAVEFHHLAR